MALRSAVALLVCGAGGAFHAPALASRRAAVPRALAALQLDEPPPPQQLPSVLFDEGSAAEEPPQQQWDDSSFDNGVGGGFEHPTPVAPPVPEPVREGRPIETIKVGLVSGPYKRRRGYHTEVAVQHPGAPETIHRLWFGHEVLGDVARLRGREEQDLDVNEFSEAVVRFLQERGVDLADPDWGMQDDEIPFSVQHLPLRTLFSYYEDLPRHLANTLLPDAEPVRALDDHESEDLGRDKEGESRAEGTLKEDQPFRCLGALGWGAGFVDLQ